MNIILEPVAPHSTHAVSNVLARPGGDHSSCNTHLDRKIDELLSVAERLRELRQRLDAEGHRLPGFFLDPYKPALEFTRLHAAQLGALFGADGWQRKANSRAHFDWLKTLPDGLHLRIIECEEIAAPEHTVPVAAFPASPAPRAH